MILKKGHDNADMGVLRQLSRLGRELVFPSRCHHCGRSLPADEGLWCAPCAIGLLEVTAGVYCLRCGADVGAYQDKASGCARCGASSWPIEATVRVGAYEGPLRNLIHRYKFGRQQLLAEPLADLLVDALLGRDWLTSLDAYVAVPADLSGRWRYGFAPAELIARRVGRRTGAPALPLVRIRGKKRRQTELPESQREDNVRHVFRLRRGARLEGASLCIIDDVSTTGSTLKAVARVLKNAGAEHVYAAIIAKTHPEAHPSFGITR